MKAKALLFLLTIFLIQCGKDEEEIEQKTTEPFEELPTDIIQSKPCETLYKGIMEMFRESRNNQVEYDLLFASSTEKRIVLTRDTEVYITFISEGAGWANSIGWYTYDKNSPPGSSNQVRKNIVFPHVSDQVLKQGDMVKIGDGPFKAGTVIGFFLITRGWENGVVNYTKTTHYTDVNLNKNSFQQHILFKEGECGDIVLAFEDRALDLKDCDFDYNDIIMTVADNRENLETVSFDLSAVAILN